MNKNILEVQHEIKAIFSEQGVAVYFETKDGACCLSFDNRVLFEDSNTETLQATFEMWCHELDKSVLGKYIVPF